MDHCPFEGCDRSFTEKTSLHAVTKDGAQAGTDGETRSFCSCYSFGQKHQPTFKIIPARPQPGFVGHFYSFIGHFWVRRGLKMILSHRAPSSLNMSSYRAIWTHFRQKIIFVWPKNIRSRKIQTFPKMQISSSSHSHKYLTYMGR